LGRTLELKPIFDTATMARCARSSSRSCASAFERIDILLIHDVDRWTHGDAFPRVFDTAMNGAYRALDELRRAGHVKAMASASTNPMSRRNPARRHLRLCDAGGAIRCSSKRHWTNSCRLPPRRKVDVIAAGVFNSGTWRRRRPTPPHL